MEQQQVNDIFQRLHETTPEPASELYYANHFELLIAVMLSAQATDESVNRATSKLFMVANTPQQILELGEAGVKSYIRSIGLYNAKAHHIIKTCHKLVDEHGGCVPQTRQELEALPGVGRKTANVILNTAFGKQTLAVDTHIFRVANRTGISPGVNVREVEDGLMAVVPKYHLAQAHHLLILHGRYTCTAKKPKCYQCVISDLCDYSYKNL